MVSEKKLEANRLNALKSTGPRTPEGKARSAQNALVSSGIFASSCVIPSIGETPELYEQFRAVYFEFAPPSNPFEAALLEDYVSCQWRLLRVRRAENGFLDDTCAATYKKSSSSTAEPFSPGFDGWSEPGRGGARLLGRASSSRRASRYLSNLSRYESRLRTASHRAFARLEKQIGKCEPTADDNSSENSDLERDNQE